MRRNIFIPTILIIAGCGADDRGMFMQEDFEAYSANQFPARTSGWLLAYTGTGLSDQQVISRAAKAGVNSMQLKGDANKDAVMARQLGELDGDITVEGWIQVTPGSAGGIALSGEGSGAGELFVGLDADGKVILTAGADVLAQVDLGSQRHHWTYVNLQIRTLAGASAVDLSVGTQVVKQDLQISLRKLSTLSLKATGSSLVLFDDVVTWTTPSQ